MVKKNYHSQNARQLAENRDYASGYTRDRHMLREGVRQLRAWHGLGAASESDVGEKYEIRGYSQLRYAEKKNERIGKSAKRSSKTRTSSSTF